MNIPLERAFQDEVDPSYRENKIIILKGYTGRRIVAEIRCFLFLVILGKNLTHLQCEFCKYEYTIGKSVSRRGGPELSREQNHYFKGVHGPPNSCRNPLFPFFGNSR